LDPIPVALGAAWVASRLWFAPARRRGGASVSRAAPPRIVTLCVVGQIVPPVQVGRLTQANVRVVECSHTRPFGEGVPSRVRLSLTGRLRTYNKGGPFGHWRYT